MIVKEDEFLEWLQHPMTQTFKKALYREREFLKENLIQGVYENEDFIKGTAKALEKILVLDYQGLIDSLEEYK